MDSSLVYRRDSTLGSDGLALETSGGTTRTGDTHPHFFSGFLTHPDVAARGLLAVADVAAARYFTPMTSQRLAEILDPVITGDGECLRFESFSVCCGVYARFDVEADGLDGKRPDRGTTNVDVNLPLRRALGGVRGGDPLRLEVGPDELAVTTLGDRVVERKVKLPERWVRGFAEAPVASRTMQLCAELDPVGARRFLGSIGSGRATAWAIASPQGLRLTTQGGPGAVCVSGPQRLAALEPLLRHATVLRVHAPAYDGRPAASAWELVLPGGRLTLTLSPELNRGFSGEGGVLASLARVDDDLVDRVLDALEWTTGSDVDTLAFALDADVDDVTAALVTLGTSGRMGYDAGAGVWFHRELPWQAERTERRNPRLAGARRLLVEGRLRHDGDVVLVDGDTGRRQVRRTADGWSCSCPWFASYGSSRGPCKHVLAVTLQEGTDQNA